MIVILIGLAIGAAVAAAGTALFSVAIVVVVMSVWGNGVMANFAHEPQAAPNYAAVLSMVAAPASIVVLIAALIIK